MHTRSRIAIGALLLALLGCRDDVISPTQPTPTAPNLTGVAAEALAFKQVSAGANYTCGVTTDDQAYCWGKTFPGTLGNGSQGDEFCQTFDECIKQPVAVAGGLRYRSISAGYEHTCGVTTDYRAYCWGANTHGMLGNGTTTGPETCYGDYDTDKHCSTRPLAVLGDKRFRAVTTGTSHTCGLTTDGLAYCWGLNWDGQLGDGTRTDRLTPKAVAGGHHFRLLSAGAFYTCGITTDYWAYCWGSNSHGQLGDSTQVVRRLRPARVAGGRQFRQLDAAYQHTCATSASYRAFCWGRGDHGQLGTGGTPLKRFWPLRVAGGLSLERVTAAVFHTCGEATNNRAYCWGFNYYGELGDGTQSQRLTPVAVAGGWFFSQLTAGSGSFTCGRTGADVAYCWGRNLQGELGDGTMTTRLTPTPVAGPT